MFHDDVPPLLPISQKPVLLPPENPYPRPRVRVLGVGIGVGDFYPWKTPVIHYSHLLPCLQELISSEKQLDPQALKQAQPNDVLFHKN